MMPVPTKLILLIFLLITLFIFVSGSKQDEGWEKVHVNNISSIIPLHHYGGKSYYMGKNFKATYHQALAFCDQINMKLLSIRSFDENERIFKYIREASVGDDYWTSGTRLVDGNNWLWLPYGETVDYTKWSRRQPSHLTEKCLQLWVVRGQLEWNDRNCDHRYYFICERLTSENNNGPTI